MRLGLALLMAAAAGLAASEDGGQALAFTKLAVGARPAAMGQAYGAVGGDAYGQASNPAVLAQLRDARVGSQWAMLPTGRSQQYLAFARPSELGDGGYFGLAFHRSALEHPIERRRANTPEPDAKFFESAGVLSATYAHWVAPQKLAVGLNYNLMNQSLGEAASGGFGLDLGGFLRTWSWLDLGLALKDLGSTITWNSGHKETLPIQLRCSAALRSGTQWLFTGQVEKSEARDLKVRLGSEFWALPQGLAFRAGWAEGQWSAGLGLRGRGFGLGGFFGLEEDAGLDYALVADSLGNGTLQHRFSLDLGIPLGML